MDILIIDDDEQVCVSLKRLLEKEGWSADYETGPGDGLERAGDASLVLLDLKIPGVEGLELLERLIAEQPRTPVVMITAHGEVEVAVQAMKCGAYDFIAKPPEKEKLVGTLRQALDASDKQLGVSELYFDLPDEVVFRDENSRLMLEQVKRVANTDLPVLLEGEPGVGKDVFAKLLHRWSGRASGPMHRINCASIPENLFESTLFGHERGAFTGADVAKPGRVELADKGTLFLDEIGDLPAPSQASLLQFAQDRSYERVGGYRTLDADVRLVAATNRDLDDAVAQRKFRADLLGRLSGLRIQVPPLRERRGDIEALAHHFLSRFCAKFGEERKFAPDSLPGLLAHGWPGNVRELEFAVWRAVQLTPGPDIHAADVLPGPSPVSTATSLRDERRMFEKARIEHALAECSGNRTEAAQNLGISRRGLQKKLKDYDIS